MARVLHIEDDPVNRRLVTKLLGAAGHEVIDATTGLEGVRAASEQTPDLVLVDINIPDLDGYEVTLRLRGIPALDGVPIVAITAEGDRDTSLAVGCDGFIAKPIDARAFARRIGRFLSGHRERGDSSREGRTLRAASHRIVERLESKVRELSAANQRLEEMARLRREFLRNVTHELATPMTPVVGYVSLLEGGELGPLNSGQVKAIEAIRSATERLRGVVDLLVDVNALEAGRLTFQMSPYEPSRVIDEALDEVSEQVRAKHLQLRREPVEAITAVGDPDRIRRALVHVLDNAVAFSPDRGRVSVGFRILRAGGDPAGEPVGFGVLIGDEGPGVPPAMLPKVFEPFFQVDGSTTRAHEGVGLGLAYSLRVAQRHGGKVRMESPPERDVAGTIPSGALAILTFALEPSRED